MKNKDLIRDAMMFAGKDITGRVLKKATVQSMIDDFENELTSHKLSLKKCKHKGKKDRMELTYWYYCHDCKSPFKLMKIK